MTEPRQYSISYLEDRLQNRTEPGLYPPALSLSNMWVSAISLLHLASVSSWKVETLSTPQDWWKKKITKYLAYFLALKYPIYGSYNTNTFEKYIPKNIYTQNLSRMFLS